MLTLDLKRDLKTLYSPSARDFEIVEVPSMRFLMVDGTGNPNTTPAYQDAISALYAVAFTLKFAIKRELGIVYPVMPLEGLWWTGERGYLDIERIDAWQWTMMIMQPEQVTNTLFAAAMDQARVKHDSPALARLRFDSYHEGLSVQILYFGPYKDEAPTIVRMHTYIEENGYEPAGKHHEIYLGDLRRSAPERLKTVLRQPVRKAPG